LGDFPHHHAQGLHQIVQFAEQAVAAGCTQGGGQIARRYACHGGLRQRRLPADLLQDRPRHRPGNAADDQQNQGDHDGGIAQLLIKQGVEIIDVEAGADDPVPGREMLQVMQFRDLDVAAGARGLRFDIRRFIERDADHVANRVSPRFVLAIPVRFPDIFRADRVHDPDALAVVDIKIFRALIAHAAQHILGDFLGFILAQFAPPGPSMKVRNGTQGNLDGGLQRGLAVCKQLGPQVKDFEGPEGHQADQGNEHREGQPPLQAAEMKCAHVCLSILFEAVCGGLWCPCYAGMPLRCAWPTHAG